jgi:hypothetical protein
VRSRWDDLGDIRRRRQEACIIRAAFERRGEISVVVYLGWLLPGITDVNWARQ